MNAGHCAGAALTIALLATAMTASSCGDNSVPKIEARALPSIQNQRHNLRWKRFWVVQNDLARALELPVAELCSELGGAVCVTSGYITVTDVVRMQGASDVQAECARLQGGATCQDGPLVYVDSPSGLHVAALGGNNALLGGVFDAPAGPSVGTPLAIDRVALAACGERAARDAQSTAPAVFSKFAIAAAAVDPTTAGLPDTITDLYRRILARDPAAAELQALLAIAAGTPAASGEQFARLACYAIATTTEFLFQ